MSTTKSLLIDKAGSAHIEDTDIRKLSSGDVLISHTAIGLTRYDVEVLDGKRKPSLYPCAVGSSAAGIVEESRNDEFKVGDRVFYCCGPVGSLSGKRVVDGNFLLKSSKSLSDDILAAMSFCGFVSVWLIDFIASIGQDIKGKVNILVNGATGRVGRILVRILSSMGISVFAHYDNESSLQRANALGCSDVFNINDPFKKKYDSCMLYVFDFLGGDFLTKSIPYLCRFGSLISVGKICPNTRCITAEEVRHNSVYIRSPSVHLSSSWGKHSRKYAQSFISLLEKSVVRQNDPVSYKFEDFAKAVDYIKERPSNKYVILKPN